MANKNSSYKTKALLYIIIILGFTVVINYLGVRYFKRADLTETKMYSISPASKKLLSNLDDIININVYISKNLPPHLKNIEADIKDMLAEFKAYGGKNLHISFIDPAENEETKQKAIGLGIPEIQMQTYEKDKAQVINGFLGIAVLFADKKEVLPIIQDVSNFEYDLAQCVMKVSRKETPKVGVLKTDTTPYIDPYVRMQMGMGRNLPGDPTEEKYKPVFDQLKQNYEVSTIDISGGKPIDASIKTIIIPGGGDRSFSERSLFEIDQFFMKGGNLIVLADAVNVDMTNGVRAEPQSPQILTLLEHYGVRIEKKLLLDASCGQVQIPQQIGMFQMNVAVNYPFICRVAEDGFNRKNPAVSGLGQMMFPWPSPLTLLVESDTAAAVLKDSTRVRATILVQSSPKSWTDAGPAFNLNPQQDWGTLMGANKDGLKRHTLAAYLKGNFTSYFTGKPVPPKQNAAPGTPLDQDDMNRTVVPSNSQRHLIVVGESDFLTPQSAMQGNTAFLLNVVDWLTLDENLIGIRSRALVDRTIKSDKLAEGKSYANMIRAINLLLMPSLLIIVGLFIFFKRKESFVETASTSQHKKEDAKV